MKITPVLLADRIEPSLPFWVDRMGFTKTVDVPGDGHLSFAILIKDDAQIMLQTWESAEKDAPQLLPKEAGSAALFIVVEDFAEVVKRLEGWEILLPERVTFYGMREIGVKDPGGNVVVFAAEESQ